MFTRQAVFNFFQISYLNKFLNLELQGNQVIIFVIIFSGCRVFHWQIIAWNLKLPSKMQIVMQKSWSICISIYDIQTYSCQFTNHKNFGYLHYRRLIHCIQSECNCIQLESRLVAAGPGKRMIDWKKFINSINYLNKSVEFWNISYKSRISHSKCHFSHP